MSLARPGADGRSGQQRGNSKPPRFYKIAEVAEQVAVSTRTVRRWIANGELVAHRFGRALRISEVDLNAFIRARCSI
jgi:excisionase family DNA binding protein